MEVYMRRLFLPLIFSLSATANLSAQTTQSTVDIGVSDLTVDKGLVQALVSRTDFEKPVDPDMKVHVTVAVKGQQPFYSAIISLRPGGQQFVAAPFKQGQGDVLFVLSATPVGVKESNEADNTRVSE